MAEAARGTKLSVADLTTGSDGGPASAPQGLAGGVKDVPLCSPGECQRESLLESGMTPDGVALPVVCEGPGVCY